MPSDTNSSADGPSTTMVGKWLRAKKADKYASAFFDQGYTDLSDLTESAITELIADNRDLARELAASLKALRDPGNDPPVTPISLKNDAGTSVSIPDLPAGTKLDLTHPTITLPGVPEFTIPAILSVSASPGQVISATELSQADWIIIARRSDILRGYTLDDIPEGGMAPPRANSLALDYVVPTAADFVTPMHLQAEVISEISYTDGAASYVKAGFDKQSASLSVPYAAASVEREHKERDAKASSQKAVHMVGRWHYPRAKLSLRKCAVASDRFVQAVQNAVNARNPQALDAVFEEFGKAVPETVVLGGELILSHVLTCKGQVNEHEAETTVKAAVNAKYSGVAASAGAAFGASESGKISASELKDIHDFKPVGGDVMLGTNPQLWPDTVKNPERWAVIRIEKLVPITEWLPQALRAEVEKLLPAIQVPESINPWRHSAMARADQFVFGARGRVGGPAAFGDFRLACGSSGSPALGEGDAVGGIVSLHSSHPDDVWIDGASLCLPVPKGKFYSLEMSDCSNTEVGANGQFVRADTKLTLGSWQLLFERKGGNAEGVYPVPAMPTDGFLFCSVRAPSEGDRGWVECGFDSKIPGAASVHNTTAARSCRIPNASFCVPLPKGTAAGVTIVPEHGQLQVKTWYLPSTSRDLRFGMPQPRGLRSTDDAETDGFLNGSIVVRQGNARGALILYFRRNESKPFPVYPLAMAAVHRTTNRFVSRSSAMLPLRRGYQFYADTRAMSQDPGHKAADANVYWTPLLPAA